MHAVVLDASTIHAWCRAAADDLYCVREAIDALNVFPVPDADTGTNLHLTMVAAADAPVSAGDAPRAAWAAIARAAILGAHGNSGVILSQLLRGVAEHAPAEGPGLARALRHAAEVAYAAVGDPVEGTMLTVAAAAARAAESAAPAELPEVALAAARGAREALDRTPEQLATLAEAGVVDAGAAGLVIVLDALARVCGGVADPAGEPPRVPAPRHGAPAVTVRSSGPAYEVMYLLDAGADAVAGLRERLAQLGDSHVVVGGDDVWKVHIHVDDVGAAVEAGLAAGRPHRVRVTHLPEPAERPAAGGTGRCVVAVVPTQGLARLFDEHGAISVVRDAASAPPTVDALCNLVPRTPGIEVVLLPDDPAGSGVVHQAVERLRARGVRAAAVPARALVQSLAALAVHQPEQAFDDDLVGMTAAAVATRHVAVPVAGTDPAARACTEVSGLLAGGQRTLVTLVHGPDVPPGLVEEVTDRLHGTAPDIEIMVYEGGPHGPVLLVGVE